MKARTVLRFVLAAAVTIILAACGSKPVAEDLNQAQANEVVAALNSVGIPASAERARGGGQARYSVQVKQSLYPQAVSLLQEKGLPSEPRPSFSDLVAPRGLMPNSREMESLRLERALGADLEETLLQHPGVASARVVVRLHSPSAEGKPAISAVVVPRQNHNVNVLELKELIARGIPGATMDGVLLVMEPKTPSAASKGPAVLSPPLTSFLWLWRVPEEDYNSLALVVVLGVFVIFGCGAVVGGSLSRYVSTSLGRGTVLRKRETGGGSSSR